jgi:glutathione S-transferase
VILDSYVIVNISTNSAATAGPCYGPRRWQVKTDHSLIDGMLDSMLLSRYEGGAAAGPAIAGVE